MGQMPVVTCLKEPTACIRLGVVMCCNVDTHHDDASFVRVRWPRAAG